MNLLVTGGNGFVGSHLVEGLLASGHRVRCLLRPSSDVSYIRDLEVERVYGSLDDRKSLERACADVDAVCHFAGATTASDARTFFRVNEGGTRALLEACCQTNPMAKRFVYCSSLSAAGPSHGLEPLTEDTTPQPVSDYGRSKLAAELVVKSYADRLPTVVLRPAPVYGPRDKDILIYFRWVARGLKLLPSTDRLPISVVHVDDVVRMCKIVIENPRAVSETYFVSDGHIRYLEAILDLIEEALGSRRAHRLVIPMTLLVGATGLLELWTRISGRPVVLSKDKLRELQQRSWLCDPGKARRELEFTAQVQLQPGLASTAAWYKSQGWL